MNPQDKYNKILKLLRKQYGTSALYSDELNNIGLHYFGKNWGGVYPHDTAPIKRVKKYFIVNTDDSNGDGEHWVACLKVKNNIYIYDSFGRQTKNVLKQFHKRLNHGKYNLIDSHRDAEQSDYQEDCGVRCISWLLIAKHDGIKKALTI